MAIVINPNAIQKGSITKEMLTQGARKPIILTQSTTKVDEETYQKLLSDDVDVLLKTDIAEVEGNLCTLTYKTDNGDYFSLYFTCFSVEGGGMDDSYLYAYQVDITKTSPHTCNITENQSTELSGLIYSMDFVNKAWIAPAIKVSLSGTNTDRKKALAQFEVNWKRLTGASDMTGARFMGTYTGVDGFTRAVLFTHNYSSGISGETYEGISTSSVVGYGGTSKNMNEKVSVNSYTGAFTITPLFSHLEAITIQTLNIPANKKKNSDAIQAYVNNLEGIGVDVTKGYTIPIKTVGFENGVGVIYPNTPVDNSYKGICIANGHSYIITISQDGTWDKRDLLDSGSDYTVLNTSAKEILSAINEINTLANNKQDTLTSGTNIKTINNQSLLGSGNIEISAPSITVDTTMSDTSTNPVQNKVIKAYIDGLVGNVAAQLAQI